MSIIRNRKIAEVKDCGNKINMVIFRKLWKMNFHRRVCIYARHCSLNKNGDYYGKNFQKFQP